jgi:hypothetical protein
MKKILMILTLLFLVSGCQKITLYTEEDLNLAVASIKETFKDDYYPQADISEEMLEMLYGIDLSRVDAYFAEGPLFTMSVDTLLIFIAHEDYVDELKNTLLDYQNYLINDSFQYPMNMPKVNASKVFVQNNLVAFIMLGAYTDNFEDENHYENESLRAIDALKSVLK